MTFGQEQWERRGEKDAELAVIRARLTTIQAELDAAEALIEARIRTPQATPPGSPIEGALWYETDVDMLRAYNGTDWVTVGNLFLWGSSNSITGDNVPPAYLTGTIPFKIQGATSVVLTNGGGAATVSYPTAFPNEVACVVACNGDASAKDNVVVGITNSLVTLSQFEAVFVDTAGARIASAFLRFNWIAIGW